MKLLSADDMREFVNQRKPTRRIGEALTIKDLGVEVFSREAANVFIKSPTVPDAIKIYG